MIWNFIELKFLKYNSIRAGSENKKGKGIVRAGTGKDWNF